MHALRNPSRFTGITDYQTWEDALLDDDDITKLVRASKLAPIYIGGDQTSDRGWLTIIHRPRPRRVRPRP